MGIYEMEESHYDNISGCSEELTVPVLGDETCEVWKFEDKQGDWVLVPHENLEEAFETLSHLYRWLRPVKHTLVFTGTWHDAREYVRDNPDTAIPF